MFSEDPVELGDPNILICYVDKFWPSVITITWMKNGQEVTEGVSETVFYRQADNGFYKFSYLPFIPTRGDYYDCRVEHWGLRDPLMTHWGEDGTLPSPSPVVGGSVPRPHPPVPSQSPRCPSPSPRAPRPWCAPWAWPWASSASSWAPSSSSRP